MLIVILTTISGNTILRRIDGVFGLDIALNDQAEVFGEWMRGIALEGVKFPDLSEAFEISECLNLVKVNYDRLKEARDEFMEEHNRGGKMLASYQQQTFHGNLLYFPTMG
ncbi:hypothetical protein Bca52824_058549 [Brassica carinata]|uniref:Uncharacterized protein n=1 Tax=Brassica carinata TaxID=52824 RepID=A0A8X7QZN9_BRACI|nr:hypothetical protein Bca52824_058549 [Brassica carinata]